MWCSKVLLGLRFGTITDTTKRVIWYDMIWYDMIWYDMSLVGHEFQPTYNVDDTLRTTDAMDDTGWHYTDVLFPVFLLLVATFKMALVASQILPALFGSDFFCRNHFYKVPIFIVNCFAPIFFPTIMFIRRMFFDPTLFGSELLWAQSFL